MSKPVAGVGEAHGVTPWASQGRAVAAGEGAAGGVGHAGHAAGAAVRRLRPPGALAEEDFLSTCSRCGQCAAACPAQCIVLEGQGGDPGHGGTEARRHEGGEGKWRFPHIVARRAPCVVCDDLACMKVCPSGALRLVDRLAIRMGVAEVDHGRCLRGAEGRGEDCRLCVTSCPIGEAALGIGGDGRVAVRSGCTGCGVCERACPTEPAAVWVKGKGNVEW